tara:strand:- start:176 stop:367 length:192 start_codon:yes stop_codon:yes gene_type:complete
MHIIDIAQNKQLKLLLTLFLGLGGLAGFLVYMEERKHRKIKEDLLNLEKSIKELQLAKLQNGK